MKQYETYKDSGVVSIGEIPKHWKISRINFLSSKVGDGLHGTPAYVEESDYAFINGNNIGEGEIVLTDKTKFVSEQEYLKNRKELTANTLLLSINGTIGNLAFYKGESIMLGKSAAYINLLPNINKEFIYYYLKSEPSLDYIFRELSGSTIKNLSLYSINKTPVPFPPSQEQTQIANYLNHKTAQLDTLIAKKEQLISLLQEERTAMINQAVTKGLDPNVPMKDSGIEWLGEIPEHWELKKLKHIFDSKNSIRVPLSSEERGKMEIKKYDYYGASGVIDKVEDYLFDEELILIGEDGANLLTRSKRLAFIAKGKYWVNNHAHIIKPKQGNIYYLCELLEMLDYSIWVTGSAQPKLTQEALMSIQLFEPSVTEQNEIYGFIKLESERINLIISKTQHEINLLKEYKTALISEVVTGKVDVREEIVN
ncbi:restriction endonuclease subunit S [Polaribacter sp.]|uniref:restriction endonuclease subunit S n=1 Tax=Polaribacter sp. TaxID=1920175 RepID=UPI003EF701B3